MTGPVVSDAEWVRLWQERMGFTDSEAARALRLKNPHKVMHEYKTSRRDVYPTTMAHMELLETLSVTAGLMAHGKISACRAMLEKTLLARVPLVNFGSGEGGEVVRSGTESTQPAGVIP